MDVGGRSPHYIYVRLSSLQFDVSMILYFRRSVAHFQDFTALKSQSALSLEVLNLQMPFSILGTLALQKSRSDIVTQAQDFSARIKS